MNETQTPSTRTPEPQTPDTITPENRSLAKQKSLADRILVYSVIGSVFVNMGWLFWVGNSNLFGGGGVADLTPKLVKLVKPPIPQKPKPKKKEPPPPPPKHQPPPPKQRPLKPPPPHQTPRPRPQRVQPIHRMNVAATTNTHAVSNIVAPPSDPNPTLGTPTASGEAKEVTPPAPAAPPPTPPAPDPPAPKPDPPAPVVHHDPPPPPDPPKPKPRPAIPDRDEPESLQNLDSKIDIPSDTEASSVTHPTVEATWEVDATGHATNIHVPSCGNPEIDRLIRDAISRSRYKPAVHNGVPVLAPLSHTFNIQIG